MNSIILPPTAPGNSNENWTNVHSLVITGANGSGKTQFGVWIEDNNPLRQVHRIAAQRALDLPPLVSPMPYEQATLHLYYGHYQPSWNKTQYNANKLNGRWGNQPTIQMLADYSLVISALFADEARRNRQYALPARNQVPHTKTPDCNLDILQRIWKAIFPHRELVIGEDKISARVPSKAEEYAGRMMSDGERVALYLLGQVLCSPQNAIIVIDEPEIHLHRAIQASLWDEAEASRPDCTFVYITHDLEFAATRSAARKVWTESFDGSHWKWQELESSTELPDNLLLQVLGNRRSVLFVEGDESSHDNTLYRALHPDKLVLPLTSCNRVISARRALMQLNALHHLSIDGLVDRDHRSDEEIDALRSQGLKIAEVAEVENLFCLPGALRAAAEQLKVPNPTELIQIAKDRVLSELQKSINSQVAARAIAEIQFRLGGFGPKAGTANLSTIQADLSKHVASIDVDGIFRKANELFNSIIANRDYESALRFYNCKGITSFVARAFGMSASPYCTMLIGIVRSEKESALAKEMRSRIS